MILLDGKKISKQILKELRTQIKSLPSTPGLAVVLVGQDPASKVYVQRKHKACQKIGMASEVMELDENVSQETLLQVIQKMNQRSDIHGILVQLPLPKHIDEHTILESVAFEKDVDGFHVMNTGKLSRGLPSLTPCTPTGVIHLLHAYDIPMEGKHAVVLGRSNIVGKPMAALLLQENATVTVCHSRTKNIKDFCLQADILVAAIGKPQWITADWIKPGAVVIDVGINRLDDGTLTGDVDYGSVKNKASYLTPVPGGVGPLTIAQLLRNTVKAYQWQREKTIKTQ